MLGVVRDLSWSRSETAATKGGTDAEFAGPDPADPSAALAGTWFAVVALANQMRSHSQEIAASTGNVTRHAEETKDATRGIRDATGQQTVVVNSLSSRVGQLTNDENAR